MEGCLDRMDLCREKYPQWAVATKCCFFVPIRKGVTIFGYVNLVSALLSLPPLIFILVDEWTSEKEETGEDSPALFEPTIHLPLSIFFLLVDVLMTVLLLVGSHKKNKLLLQIYFFFGVVFQLVTLCVDLFYLDYREHVQNVVYFFLLGLNIYLLFLVYNTVRLIEEGAEVQYIAYRESRR